MTHDVDAVAKTLPIRLKQGAFNLLNAGRAITAGNVRRSISCLKQAKRFLIGSEDWWLLDKLVEQEAATGIRSHFNFFADQRHKTFTRWLFDPGYTLSDTRLSDFMRTIQKKGWTIGLHPSFDAWQSPALIQDQKEHLEKTSGADVKTCRQHWLRFSWDRTWLAQQKAGIKLDTTLMFNDRPGFRTGAALQWHPWNSRVHSHYALEALPTVLMDSHFYDYQPVGSQDCQISMAHWLDEVTTVGGQAAVLWHPHTLTQDYGWQEGFNDLLTSMKRIKS
ncbi:hypothetical protein GCM10027278_36870 [Paralcaligenes ginsengisoli]